MRFMVLVKATQDSEAGLVANDEMFAEMGRFNSDLSAAGILEVAEGLKPSSQGVRVKFSGTDRTVVEGPFLETNELVAGYWIWNCKSLQEAISWVKRCPNPMLSDSEIEIRPLYSSEDLKPNKEN